MKISTRGRYGLKAMVDLAANAQGDCLVSLKSIAEREGISEHYLEQIIAVLKKDGFVKSVRGAQGGYCLNKKPEDISVGDILRSLEGPLHIVECVAQKDSASCGSGNCKKCVTKNVWERISDSLAEVVDSITLKDLVEEYNTREM